MTTPQRAESIDSSTIGAESARPANLADGNGLGQLTSQDIQRLNTNTTNTHLHTVEFDNTAGGAAAGQLGLSAEAQSQTPHFEKPLAKKTGALPVGSFAKLAMHIFDDIDGNQDGILNEDELAAAVMNSEFTGRNAQVVTALYQEREDLTRVNFDFLAFGTGITRDDLEAFQNLARSEDPAEVKFGNVVTDVDRQLRQTAQEQIGATTDEPLYRSDNPLQSINPSAIEQGQIGNCYLEAVIASIAGSNPEAIQRMIHDNGNGTFTVTFPGDPDNPVTVPRPTQAEMGLYQHHTKYGIWPNVLERAAGEYMQNHTTRTWGNTPQEATGGGGFSRDALQLLTGTQAEHNILPLTMSGTTQRRLTEAFDEGRAVTVASNGFGLWDRTLDGYQTQHVYSVIGWDPEGPDGGTVTLRNPWGDPNVRYGAESRVSLNQLIANFTNINYEGRPQESIWDAVWEAMATPNPLIMF